MNDNIKSLLKTIQNNPYLPVICMVDSDIVFDDGYRRWMAQIGHCEVGEYATYNERFYDDREEFMEYYYSHNDEILDERFGYNPCMSLQDAQKRYTNADIEANEEAEARLNKYLNEVADRVFKKAIIVYIDMPDEI